MRHHILAACTAALLLSAASPLVSAAENGKATSKKITPATPAIPAVTVYAAGDIADCRKKPPAESMAARTATLIATGLSKDASARAITLGDNTYPVGKPDEFNKCYEPTWGQFKDRTLPSPGNHDYAMPKALGYYNYFGDLAGPERRGYYASQLGKWLVLSLNSNLDPQQMQVQLNWLKEELAKNKQNCTLAFWHHPVFSSGGHGNNDNMQAAWKMLAAAKADIVLTSHDHDYERFAPLDANGDRDDKRGIRSFVVGTGGAKLTPMFLPRGNTEIRDNSTHGVLKLSLAEKSYEWEFLPVPGGSFTDKGKDVCH
ncbi:metallophosphoesterase [Undibacterium sp. TS12]|uniref:metallophosphoesterase family protein n=1 Tax=Undibacterium sp. TS12 TaxID=2908202 RepID=UPI001F4D0EFC|nr:metallophosphoesterase [Undibacterium sp. TS12]MCH8619226.1 metallophosphoesterase [Undibacterium sp. TS12]